jgi:hypothetical protein
MIYLPYWIRKGNSGELEGTHRNSRKGVTYRKSVVLTDGREHGHYSRVWWVIRLDLDEYMGCGGVWG